MDNAKPDQLKLAYRVSEVCWKTSMGRSSIYTAIKEGQLRAVKCGGRTLILAHDLDAYLGRLPAMQS
ncbi:MAG: helix-turn-helix domain-containing protein [Pseudomonadota bacterium]